MDKFNWGGIVTWWAAVAAQRFPRKIVEKLILTHSSSSGIGRFNNYWSIKQMTTFCHFVSVHFGCAQHVCCKVPVNMHCLQQCVCVCMLTGFDSDWYYKAISSKEVKIGDRETDNSWWYSWLQTSECFILMCCMYFASSRTYAAVENWHVKIIKTFTRHFLWSGVIGCQWVFVTCANLLFCSF